MHHSTTFLCSSCDSVGLSPVVPTGTSPFVTSEICTSQMAWKDFPTSEPFLNGVTSAVKEPRKLVLAVMARLLHRGSGMSPNQYRVGGEDDSPPRRVNGQSALFLP